MNGHTLTARQRLALLWLGAISPVFQRLPGALLQQGAGAAAWLAPILALVPLGLAGLLFCRLLRPLPGLGLAEGLCRCLGQPLGRGLSLVFAAWAVVLCASSLRSGAERFCFAVFPQSGAAPFLLVMSALGLMGALGRLRTLGRMAEAVLPFLLLGLALVLLPGLPGIEVENLRIPDGAQIPPAALGSLVVTNTASAAAFAAFLPGESVGRRRDWLWVFCSLGLLGLLLCAVTLGRLGAELSGELPYPFFLLLRDLRFLRLLERVEALLCAQWVFTDFFLTAVLLSAAGLCAATVCTGDGTRRRWPTVFASAAALGLAWLNPAALWGLLPTGNALLLFGGLTLTLVVGRLRKVA